MEPMVEMGVADTAGAPAAKSDAAPVVSRAFFAASHHALRVALGRSTYEAALFEAGRASAYHWCQTRDTHSDAAGISMLKAYLAELSRRHWGRFELAEADPATGYGLIRIRDSVFAAVSTEAPACGMFHGWLVGAMQYAAAKEGAPPTLRCRELRCAACSRSDVCELRVERLLPAAVVS